MVIAATGHSSAQRPQPKHSAAFTTATFFAGADGLSSCFGVSSSLTSFCLASSPASGRFFTRICSETPETVIAGPSGSGQTFRQTPHPMQWSPLTTAFLPSAPDTISMAVAGQFEAQMPQPTQESEFTDAMPMRVRCFSASESGRSAFGGQMFEQ